MIKSKLVEDTQVYMVYGNNLGELPDFIECAKFGRRKEYDELCADLYKSVRLLKNEYKEKYDYNIIDSDLNLWICYVSTYTEDEAEKLAGNLYRTNLFVVGSNWKRLFGTGMAYCGINWAGKEIINEISSLFAEDDYDPNIESKLEDLGTSIDYSGFGLFWFNDDFTEVEIAEKNIFDERDLAPNIFKSPKKSHYDYDENFLNRKRGRVVLEAGRIVIYVGKNCPTFNPMEYDSEESPKMGTNLVLKEFNLDGYKYIIYIRQDTHWNGYGY